MDLLQNIRGLFEAVHFIDGAQLPRPDCWSTQPHQADTVSWEYIGSKTCDKPCHLPSSAGNTVTMELATVNDENPCGDRGLDAVCPPLAIDGTDGEKWRRRESNECPRCRKRNQLTVMQQAVDLLSALGQHLDVSSLWWMASIGTKNRVGPKHSTDR
ncbi:MAG: hypothetical protein VB857_15295 [Pirellulaceae bacterium]